MAKVTVENSSLRLKSVLDVLTESVWSGDVRNAGEVLAEATARVPFSTHESELLSGGIPRGHKALTASTAKLVKAGWLVKGRSGWTITEDGMRATVAFPDAASFMAALDAGTPVPADTPVPEAPAGKAAAKAPAKAPAKTKTAAKAKAPAKDKTPVQKAAQLIEDAVQPVVKAVRSRKAKVSAETAAAAPENGVAPDSASPAKNGEPAAHAASAVETFPQPEAVAVAGNFNILLGAEEDWAPQYDEAQLSFDALDQQWKITAELPAGFYTFKIALNRSWDENYGAFGTFDGANHELHHAGGPLSISYDHRTRDITINS